MKHVQYDNQLRAFERKSGARTPGSVLGPRTPSHRPHSFASQLGEAENSLAMQQNRYLRASLTLVIIVFAAVNLFSYLFRGKQCAFRFAQKHEKK